MATPSQQTLASAASGNSAHGPLLANSSASATVPSLHFSQCTSGRLGSPSGAKTGDDGSGYGCGSGGNIRPLIPRSSPSPALSSLSSGPLSSQTPNNHSQADRPSSRRFRPCSLCGTSAVRPQPSFLPTSSAGLLEQPIVLLHRLEDGLPQGDVKSLHAYGTIRLLSVQAGQSQDVLDESNHVEDGEAAVRRPTELATDKYDQGGANKNKQSFIVDSEDETLEEEFTEDSDGEGRVNSVFLKENYPLEAIIETEVTVSTLNDWEDGMKSDGDDNHMKIGRITWPTYDGENSIDGDNCSNLNIHIEKVESIKDKQDDSEVFSTSIAESELHTQSMVPEYLENENKASIDIEPAVSETSLVKPSSLQPCSRGQEISPSSDKQSNLNKYSKSNSLCSSTLLGKDPVCTSSATSSVSPSSTCSTVSASSMPDISTTQAVSSPNASPVADSLQDSASVTICSKSKNIANLFPPHSSTATCSSLTWSPLAASLHQYESPPLLSHNYPSPKMLLSPPSPPSPCESPSFPFSPPPSPSPDFIQTNSSGRIGKEESQTCPLSPYSPESSPSFTLSPAQPLSPSDSPPSPTVSEDSTQIFPEPLSSAPNEEGNLVSDCADLTNSLDVPVQSDGTSTTQQHNVNFPHFKVTPSPNAQDECSLNVNDKSPCIQVESEKNPQKNTLVASSETMACDDNEMKSKPKLDSCSDDNEEKTIAGGESDSNPMKIKVRIRPRLDTSPVPVITSDENSRNGIPKIVLTLKGNGPNKEYSCSNRLRNEDHSICNVDTVYKKHKSKKDRKEKERCKVKKNIKGNKHKRHLELFGEDSNDSFEFGSNNCDKVNGQDKNPLSVTNESKGDESPRIFDIPNDSSDNSENDCYVPSVKPQYNYSENVERCCQKLKHSSPDKVDNLDDSFSDSLPDVDVEKNVLLSQNKLPLDTIKKEVEEVQPTKKSIIDKNNEVQKNKKKNTTSKKELEPHSNKDGKCAQKERQCRKESKSSVENKKANDHSKVIETSSNSVTKNNQEKQSKVSHKQAKECVNSKIKKGDSEVPVSSSGVQEKSLEQSASCQQSSPTVNPNPAVKEESISTNESDAVSKKGCSNVRTRHERHTKKCDTDQDSDSCLWVSFGVEGRVKVPASDIPNFGSNFGYKGNRISESSSSQRDKSKFQNLDETGSNFSDKNTSVAAVSDKKNAASTKMTTTAIKKQEEGSSVSKHPSRNNKNNNFSSTKDALDVAVSTAIVKNDNVTPSISAAKEMGQVKDISPSASTKNSTMNINCPEANIKKNNAIIPKPTIDSDVKANIPKTTTEDDTERINISTEAIKMDSVAADISNTIAEKGIGIISGCKEDNTSISNPERVKENVSERMTPTTDSKKLEDTASATHADNTSNPTATVANDAVNLHHVTTAIGVDDASTKITTVTTKIDDGSINIPVTPINQSDTRTSVLKGPGNYSFASTINKENTVSYVDSSTTSIVSASASILPATIEKDNAETSTSQKIIERSVESNSVLEPATEKGDVELNHPSESIENNDANTSIPVTTIEKVPSNVCTPVSKVHESFSSNSGSITELPDAVAYVHKTSSEKDKSYSGLSNEIANNDEIIDQSLPLDCSNKATLGELCIDLRSKHTSVTGKENAFSDTADQFVEKIADLVTAQFYQGEKSVSRDLDLMQKEEGYIHKHYMSLDMSTSQAPEKVPPNCDSMQPEAQHTYAPRQILKQSSQSPDYQCARGNIIENLKSAQRYTSKHVAEEHIEENLHIPYQPSMPNILDLKSEKILKHKSKEPDPLLMTCNQMHTFGADVENDQYYPPMKIQKLLNENVQKIPVSSAELNHDTHEVTKSQSTSAADSNANMLKETVHPVTSSTFDCKDTQGHPGEVYRSDISALGSGSSLSAVDTSKLNTNDFGKVNDVSLDESAPGATEITPPPHDPEYEKVWGDRERKKMKSRHRRHSCRSVVHTRISSASKRTEKQSEAAAPPEKESSSIKDATTAPHQDKEVKKKTRKSRKKDGSESDSSTAARREDIGGHEVKKVEERERRLAQEIKGFNWLEEKIKNGSLTTATRPPPPPPPPAPAPAVVHTSALSIIPCPIKPPPPLLSKSNSLPATTVLESTVPPIPSVAQRKDAEGHYRTNSYPGCSPAFGLRGHLQTAVPPLIHSSRITALPKRRSSVHSPSAPTPTAGSGVANVAVSSSSSSVTEGNINTSMGVVHKAPVSSAMEHSLSKAAAAAAVSEYTSLDCNKATLYSSTDSNTATLYGIPAPQLEVLFEVANSQAETLQSNPTDQGQKTFPVSVQYPPVPAARLGQQTSVTQAQTFVTQGNPTVISSTKPCVSIEPVPGPIPASVSSNSPRFSHKHALLKRAFVDMLKREPKLDDGNASAKANETVIQDVVNESESKKPEDLTVPLNTDSSIVKKENSPSSEDKSHVNLAVHQPSEVKDRVEPEVVPIELDKEKPVKCIKEEENKDSKASVQVKQEEAVVDLEPVKSETKSSSEAHQNELFNKILEELRKTQQEVQILRKQLKEKNEKDDDPIVKPAETSTKIKAEKPVSTESTDANNQSDDDLVICEEKPAVITIRNDLLADSNRVSPASRTSVASSTPTSTVTTPVPKMSPKPPVSMPDKPLLTPSPKASPVIPLASPKSNRVSPRSCQVSPSLSRTSPIINFASQENASQFHNIPYSHAGQSMVHAVSHAGLPLPHMSPVASHTPIVSPYSSSGMSTGTPAGSPNLQKNSQGFVRCNRGSLGSPTTPKGSPVIPKISPVAAFGSPGITREINIDVVNDSVNTNFVINPQIEVTPVSINNRPTLTEPVPQTYLELVGGERPQAHDNSLQLGTIRNKKQDYASILSENETTITPVTVPLNQHPPTEILKRVMQNQTAETEIKRARYSTSDLPEFPSTSQKAPPPLKPVATIQRRYSDNTDIRKTTETVLVPFPSPNMHPHSSSPSTSSDTNPPTRTSPKQPVAKLPQNHPNIGIDANVERSREFQQAVHLQHHYPQHQPPIGPLQPMTRSLGPEKATLYPIPAPGVVPAIRPYGKPLAPTAGACNPMMEHQQKSPMHDASSMNFFQKLKQTAQQNYDSGLANAAQERLQAAPGTFEKARQPQTFAARVLVRDSVPEKPPSQMPPPPIFPGQQYPNCNPHLQNVMQNHSYLNHMHRTTGAGMHPMVAGGLIRGNLQPSATSMLGHTPNPRGKVVRNGSEKLCLRCPQPAKFLCSGCKKACYCSENCQREHWVIHNTGCTS